MPHRNGLLGHTEARGLLSPPRRAGPSGVLGALSEIFTGPAAQGLTPEQNAAARRQGIITSVLAAILASDRSQSLLPVLAQGALAGQQAGGMARQQIGRQVQQQQTADLIQGFGPSVELPELHRLFTQAVATGDPDQARNIATVIQSVQAAQKGPQVRLERFVGGDGFVRTFNPVTGETTLLRDNEGNPIRGRTGTQAAGRDPEVVIDPDTGERIFASFDPTTFSFVPVKGGRPLPKEEAGAGGTGQERLNAQLGAAAANANRLLNEVDEALTNPVNATAAGTGLFSGPANILATDRGQAAATAALNFLNPTVRYLSGAQMTEQESRRYYRALVPRVGDSEATVTLKRRMREALIRAMNQGEIPRGTPGPDGEPDFANVDRALARIASEVGASVDDLLGDDDESDAEGGAQDDAGVFSDLVPENGS